MRERPRPAAASTSTLRPRLLKARSMRCHTAETRVTLRFEMTQLNRDVVDLP
jgi:hypothetical protein